MRCCCHMAMLPGRRRRLSELSTGRPLRSYQYDSRLRVTVRRASCLRCGGLTARGGGRHPRPGMAGVSRTFHSLRAAPLRP
ncbi:hypothetical protein SBD_4121 [Streptomyces bottropensis ATCC 25435]|uniref:Uncharacterized protein n=1 Tax=Streptomyces bottropensis ATCC 25435 TaxID=1054862 RepID=M3EYW8_9ACTN|nr:hypothetical protein SBD_4121 [Streptomyces bottropensis ATCC 25435]